MPREAKIVYVRRNDPVYPLVFLNECFGWELQQLNAQEIVLSRETHNPNYSTLVEYENKYKNLENEIIKTKAPVKPKEPAPFNILLFLVLLALMVIPAVIYVVIALKNEKTYKEFLIPQYNKKLKQYNQDIAHLKQEMESVKLQSRAVFYNAHVESSEVVTPLDNAKE